MSVLLMEPASDAKRRHVTSMLREPGKAQAAEEDVRQKLKDMRNDSLGRLDELIARLAARLSPGVGLDVSLAVDASQAVDAIVAIAGDSRLAVNKSAVVANELLPLLVASGREVILSYPHEFPSPDGAPREYWELADMSFDSRFATFEKTDDLAPSRWASVQMNGTKDFVALLGVSAISADGTILLLQHMQNIRKAFEQAKEVIFVAGIDKIVAHTDDAVLQTQCMAAFGSEVLPLSFGSNENRRSIDELPFVHTPASCEPRPFHVVLLDNGRSATMRGRYQELLRCIDCRACAKDCPGSRFFSEQRAWSPREYLYYAVVGETSGLERCLQCKTCQANCPLDIDIPRMVIERKAELLRKRRESLANIILSKGGSMERWGSAFPRLANLVLGAAPFRWLGDKALGISRYRRMPSMSTQSFSDWYGARTTRK